MTQAEKLEALVQKAIDGGWKGRHGILPKNWDIPFYRELTIKNLFELDSYMLIIFSHEFARALFGYEDITYQLPPNAWPDNCFKISESLKWKFTMPADDFQRSQAVISEDPIGYMYDAMFNEKSGE